MAQIQKVGPEGFSTYVEYIIILSTNKSLLICRDRWIKASLLRPDCICARYILDVPFLSVLAHELLEQSDRAYSGSVCHHVAAVPAKRALCAGSCRTGALDVHASVGRAGTGAACHLAALCPVFGLWRLGRVQGCVHPGAAWTGCTALCRSGPGGGTQSK